MDFYRPSTSADARTQALLCSPCQGICKDISATEDKRGKAKREDSVLLTANTMENHPINLDAKTGILKTANTVCWSVEPLESTDKPEYFLPGCKQIRPQAYMLFQQWYVGPKKLLTGLTRDRDQQKQECSH